MSRFAAPKLTVLLLLGCCASITCAALLPGAVVARPSKNNTEQQLSLIAIGGSQTTWSGSSTAAVDIISLTTNQHRNGAPSPSTNSMFGSVKVNNTIYVVGGDWHKNFWAYDIPSDTWTVMPEFPETNAGTTLVEINGTLIAVGGTYYHCQCISEHVYAYDLSDGQNGVWVPVGTRPDGWGYFPCAVAVNGTIFYMDFGPNAFKSNDMGTSWQSIAPAPHDAMLRACVAVGDDQILAIGGTDNGLTAWFQTYNIKLNSWTSSWGFPEARQGHAAVVLPGGDDVLICGGDMGFGKAFTDCVTYNVKKQHWKASNYSLNQPRSSFGLFVAQTPL